MNQKTYCPLGKIDCWRFLGISDGGGFVRCTIANKGIDYYLMDKLFELCPVPSNQQKIERYDMCEDQPAQIDCRKTDCIWHNGSGSCLNISPAITLNSNCNFANCWSYKQK